MSPRKRLGVLISGKGSNLQALLDAAKDPAFPAEVALVVSNKADAGGLQRAADAHIPSLVVPTNGPNGLARFESACLEALRNARVDLVCLAGFMRLLSAAFVTAWHNRMLNIHPSLLPAFRGMDAVGQALAAGVRITGCTVHLVRPEMDTGPILVQAAVPVLPGDTEATLARRIQTAEHRCYPAAIGLLARGAIAIQGERAMDQGPIGAEADPLIVPAPTGT